MHHHRKWMIIGGPCATIFIIVISLIGTPSDLWTPVGGTEFGSSRSVSKRDKTMNCDLNL